MRAHRYNLCMQENRSYLPSADRMGVLIASVLLTFALTRLIQSPRFTLTITLPGFYFAYPLTLGTAMTVLAAALRVAPGHRKLEFDFTALSFTSPENVHFRYRLNDFDQKWIEAGLQRRAPGAGRGSPARLPDRPG